MIDNELEEYRRTAVVAATDLLYSHETIDKIKEASTYSAISNVMKQARQTNDREKPGSRRKPRKDFMEYNEN